MISSGRKNAAFKILKTRLKAVPSYSFNGGSQISEDGDMALDRGNSLNGIIFSASLQQFQQMQHQHRVHLKIQTSKYSSSSSKVAYHIHSACYYS
ncbi:hypothetical protein ACSQ67_019200 [Phaseolus vulgaris]